VRSAEVGSRISLLHWNIYAGPLRNKNLQPFLIQFFCFFISFSLFFSGFPLFAEHRLAYGPKEVGYVFAYTGLLGLIIQGGLLGKWVKRWGELSLVKWGLYSMVIGYLILATSFHLSTLLIAATVSAFGTAVLRPALTALISKQTPPEHQGLTLGLSQSMNSVAQIFAPILAGAMIEHAPLWTWAVVSAAIVGVAILFMKRAREAQARIESLT
ncbi:MAG: MFS transporter, partial [Proteobacteria bacterium]